MGSPPNEILATQMTGEISEIPLRTVAPLPEKVETTQLGSILWDRKHCIWIVRIADPIWVVGIEGLAQRF